MIASKEKMITPESSPEGHWSKNFAALSIHRRKDWAVTMKGFNRFVWDFEHSIDENIYGMFGSHGAMLVANNESVLEAHDVQRGWDWSKVSGATTIGWGDRQNMDNLKSNQSRFYSPSPSLAGGVTLKGTNFFANGLFGMELHQPNYGFTDWRKDIIFSFKKSVFFFENLLVCLGSEIYAARTGGSVIQTTLFQDKLVDRASPPSHIEIHNVKKNYSTPFPATIPINDQKKYASVRDTKGNGYYVPEESAENLRVHVLDQVSRTDDGQKASVDRYGTAWFEHTASMSSPSGYQYAVVIPTPSYVLTLDSLITAQENAGSEAYNVLQRDYAAHVVQFLRSPITMETEMESRTTGYVIFDAQYLLPVEGPLKAVNRPCIIMVEESSEFLHLSISYPDLDFPVTPDIEPLTHSQKVDQEMLFHVSSKENKVQVTLKYQVDKSIAGTKVHGDPSHYTPEVTVISASSNSLHTGDTIVFWNLQNGFSVEVSLTRGEMNIPSSQISRREK